MKGIYYMLSVAVIAVMALAALTLVGLDHQAQTPNLVIISSHPEPVKVEFARAFVEHYKETTGKSVDIEWLSPGGGAQDQQRYIETQFRQLETAKKRRQIGEYLPWMPLVRRTLFGTQRERESIGVDIFWGGGDTPYSALKKEGYLQPVKLPKNLLDGITPVCAGIDVYDKEGYWYGTALSGFGIIYNKELIAQMKLLTPEAWQDLADPRLVGLVSSGDPRQSGTAHMMIEIILQAYGWEKGFEIVTKMAANIRTFSDSSALVPASVGLGESLYGLAIDFYAWSQVHKDKPGRVDFVMPKGLTVVNPDGIAILKGAPHPELAQAFVEFVLSEKGQMLWLLPPGAPNGPKRYHLDRISVVPTAYERCGNLCTVPYEPTDFKTQDWRYDRDKARDRRDLLNDLMGALLIDTHAELVAAWEAVIRKNMPLDSVFADRPAGPAGLKAGQAGLPIGRNIDVRKLCVVPITEAEASSLAQSVWKDKEKTAERNRQIAEWIDQARKRYADLAGTEDRRKMGPLAWGAGAAAVMVIVIFAVILARRRARAARHLRA